MVTTPAPTPTAWKISLYFVFAPKINESSIHNEDYFEMTRGVQIFPKLKNGKIPSYIPHLLPPPPPPPPQEYLHLFEEMMSYFGLKRIKNNGIWGLSGFLDSLKLKRIEYVMLG